MLLRPFNETWVAAPKHGIASRVHAFFPFLRITHGLFTCQDGDTYRVTETYQYELRIRE